MSEKQPDPIPNHHPALWDLIISDMKGRDELGLKNYGTRLQPFNGRSAIKDVYEELLDGMVYLKQLQIELHTISSQIKEVADMMAEQTEVKEKLDSVTSKLETFLL